MIKVFYRMAVLDKSVDLRARRMLSAPINRLKNHQYHLTQHLEYKGGFSWKRNTIRMNFLCGKQ
jgi:hypothetical protein